MLAWWMDGVNWMSLQAEEDGVVMVGWSRENLRPKVSHVAFVSINRLSFELHHEKHSFLRLIRLSLRVDHEDMHERLEGNTISQTHCETKTSREITKRGSSKHRHFDYLKPSIVFHLRAPASYFLCQYPHVRLVWFPNICSDSFRSNVTSSSMSLVEKLNRFSSGFALKMISSRRPKWYWLPNTIVLFSLADRVYQFASPNSTIAIRRRCCVCLPGFA